MDTDIEAVALQKLSACIWEINPELPITRLAIQLLTHLLRHCLQGFCVVHLLTETNINLAWCTFGPRSAHIMIFEYGLSVRYQNRWREFLPDELYAASDYANDITNDIVAPGY